MKAALIIILALATQITRAQDHDHHSEKHQGKETKVQDLGSKKFIATDDLKVRMEKILSLMKELEANSKDQKSLREYGVKITDVVNDIFKTCKLEPAADAAAHPVLAKILLGAAEIKNNKYDSGHLKIHAGLMDYEKLFSHKGWKH